MRPSLGRLGRAAAGLLLVLGFASVLAPIVQTLTSAPASASTNLIENGSFETPLAPSCTDAYDCPNEGFETLTPSSQGLTDWTIGGPGIDLVNNHWEAENGVQSVDLAGGVGGGSVSQTVTTVTGDTYTLSWWMAGNPDNGPAIKTMDVYWNGTLIDDPSFNTAGHTDASMGWVEEQVDFIATSTSSTVEFADASSPQSGYGATLDNVSLTPMDTTDCASPTGFSDNFAADTSLSDCWETGIPILTPGVPDSDAVNAAISMAPDLTFNGSDMDMQGAAANPEFTGIESAATYQAPFDFTTTVKAVQSGDNAFVVYLANTTGGGVSLEGNLSGDSTGVWAAEAGDYLGAGSDIDSSDQGQVISGLSSPQLGTTFQISISMDTDADFSITVNGNPITSATLGRVGNGPFRVILGQRESDDEQLGTPTPPPPTGPNEAAWYSASLTTNYCSSSSSGSFSTDFSLDFALSGAYEGNLQDCWQAEQVSPVMAIPGAIYNAEQAADWTDEPPDLTFETNSDLFSPMQMAGTKGDNEFTGIQSSYDYSAPFELQTSVEGVQSNGSAFAVLLAGATGDITLEGDLNPADSNYGIWADSGIGVSASREIMPVLSPNTPATGVTYDITMSVDSAGDGTVTVSYSGGSDTASVGHVGTGPFYAILGQHEGTPATPGANVANWYSASLTPGSATVTATLSASSPTVAGVETVPASAVPASSVDTPTGSDDAASAPLDSIPLDSIGLGSAPLDSIPLDSIPLDSIAAPGTGAPSGLAAAAQALSETLLSEIGITYPAGCGASGPTCTGWQGVLAGTPYAEAPLESVTLADVVTNPTADANFNSVDLGSLDLASSPLDSIPLDSIELGATPLDSIPLTTTPANSGAAGAQAAWCTELASLNFPCSDFGIPDSSGGDNGVTLLTLALAGVPLDS
ncbi:MAG TPA: choice-of-anchor C family protein, partial [Acidimicrobiales bacterium]|nr:choice-of-anchor C family protein [Acidimicrobiales bacterium]